MASSTANRDESPVPTIHISILSPSPEVPGRLIFNDVPVNETIADLKSRIQQAVPSRPAFDKQRIIYRGRALVQHDLSLQSVLGNESTNSNDPFTFHLVLSPINTSSHNSTRPDGLHQPTGLPSLPLTSSLHQALNVPPRPASTSQMPEPGRPAAGLAQNLPANAFPGMMPPGFPHAPNMGFHMQFGPNTRPLFPSHLHPGMNVPNPIVQPVGAPAPWLHDPQVQMAMAQHQLLHQQFQQDIMNRGRNATRFEHPPGSHPTSQPPPPFPLRDANGTRTALSTPGTITPPPNHVHPPSSAEPAGVSSRPSSTSRHLHPSGSLASIHAANLHAIRQNQLQNMQLDQSAQFNQLRNAIGNPFPAMRTSVTSTSTVYLLSSPRGPEALLMSPTGTFTSPGYPSIGHPSPQPEQSSTTTTNTSHNQATPTTAVPAPTPTVPQAQQPPQQAAQVQPPQQRQDQAGDLLRILLPLGGQLWLIVRIIGFVYLFSIGRGWRNTILLGTIAFIGFLAQMGVFNPLLRTVWQPIREHVDGIINPERVSDPRNLTPQQMADRIMRERRANENVLRRTARRAERSAILFAASLIPGVGESQVRARENLNRLVREAGEAAERARLLAEQAEQNAEPDGEEKQAEKEDTPAAEEESADASQDPAAQRLVDVD